MTPSLSVEMSSADTSAMNSPTVPPARVQTQVTTGRQVTRDRKKRPLNAFIAFRSYYSPQLLGLTQKAKSGMLKKMWNGEPRKHFFALLAQAYSQIRDNHADIDDKKLLKKFLATVVGILPVIPAEQYLATMGWTRTVNQEGQAELVRTHDHTSKPDTSMRTNLSAEDLVNYCFKLGLATHPVSQNGSQSINRQAPAAAMAFAAAPLTSAAEMEEICRQDLPEVGNTQTNPATSTDEATPASSSSPSIAAEFDFNDLRTSYSPSIEMVTADQQQAYARYPLATRFSPEIHPPVLGFDSNLIQDDFDPFSFDIGEYLDFEI